MLLGFEAQGSGACLEWTLLAEVHHERCSLALPKTSAGEFRPASTGIRQDRSATDSIEPSELNGPRDSRRHLKLKGAYDCELRYMPQTTGYWALREGLF